MLRPNPKMTHSIRESSGWAWETSCLSYHSGWSHGGMGQPTLEAIIVLFLFA